MKAVWSRMIPLLLAACFAPAVLVGCHQDSGLNTEQQQTANRLDEIAKKSGGDWDKISQGDRDYLIKQLGSEQGARMVMAAKGGKLKARPGSAGQGGQ